jgi:predicted DCC family thiol-disulfide oxidoreductase YuxK
MNVRDAPPASGPPERWVLLYDADCGFCKWTVSRLLAWDRRRSLLPCAIQSADGQALLSDLAPTERLRSAHLVSPDGTLRSGGAAAAPLLRLLPAGALPALMIARLPRLTSWTYAWVAAHRTQLSRTVPAAAKRRASERITHEEAERASTPTQRPAAGLTPEARAR